MTHASAAFQTVRTAVGWRLIQHGVVLSELRSHPGPTQSVFDVLAALATTQKPQGSLGLLGFAAGSLMAPLRFLQPGTPVAAVDLDPTGHTFFLQHCAPWAQPLAWQQDDAVRWLCRHTPAFAVLIDDLSIPTRDDVIKPTVSFDVLPALMRRRVASGGIVISNLLRPTQQSWSGVEARFTALFSAVHVIHLDDFENRIVVAAQVLPTARALGRQLRSALRQLGSRQANRLRVRTLGHPTL